MVSEVVDRFLRFLETGGIVLWAILVLASVLWTLLLERSYYLLVKSPGLTRRVVDQWKARRDTTSWYAKRIRLAMISEFNEDMTKSLIVAKTLVALCPLLGILGTVTGMIEVFDVMAFSGSGNARGMASGISRATLPTMSGLVVAISAISVVVRLERRAERATEKMADQLRHF
ncbi:MotA/TolQ/ExbB proton channel family protein [Opitutales bacterium ASA1]|jgi:biopolymer transport protein ExbB|uniref:MotA/TolQ/ExbB proton channel family protein n=1 Tax=Congregicoccus parvus TaxID=3081749 RepID=UPI002B2C7BAB|nr:MotA/TolQ/ExbB proton channel family protein [Opitutales bacterium ASA1]